MALTAVAALLAVTWLRSPISPANHELALTLEPLALPTADSRGPFRLTGAWVLTSPNSTFGGYSALILPVPGRLFAVSDRGHYLDFAEPGLPQTRIGIGPALAMPTIIKRNRDAESATMDPASGQVWFGLEGRSLVVRQDRLLGQETQRVIPEWRDWGANSGPEAMVRLHDGRFLALCECSRGWFDGANHPATLFPGDPVAGTPATGFTFAGPDGYRPTDMAELPDGRVLVVMRRLRWPIPARFAVKLVLADPAAIVPGRTWTATELIDLAAPWPVDNYEALAIEPLPDGRILAWIMSDENEAVTQRVLLLRLEFRLSDLPSKQKAPG